LRSINNSSSAQLSHLDGRMQSIFGGTTEIMKEIVGRGLGL
jgi:hypothetical protein